MFRIFRRNRKSTTTTQVEKSYALLASKLARRLGIARSRARQAEQEAAFWKDLTQQMRRTREAEDAQRYLEQWVADDHGAWAP